MVFWHQHWNGNEVLGARWVVEIVFAAFRPPPLPHPRIIFVVPPNIAQMKWIRPLKEFDFPARVFDHPAPVVVRSFYRHTLPMVLMILERSVPVFFAPKHVFDHLNAGGAQWVVEIRLVVVLCDRAASAEVNDIVGTVFWCQGLSGRRIVSTGKMATMCLQVLIFGRHLCCVRTRLGEG